MSVESSFRKGYRPYSHVMWKVDSLEKDMKCDTAVTVVGVRG